MYYYHQNCYELTRYKFKGLSVGLSSVSWYTGQLRHPVWQKPTEPLENYYYDHWNVTNKSYITRSRDFTVHLLVVDRQTITVMSPKVPHQHIAIVLDPVCYLRGTWNDYIWYLCYMTPDVLSLFCTTCSHVSLYHNITSRNVTSSDDYIF